MPQRLAAVVVCAALAACSAPKSKTCAQTSECGTGYVCSAGYCQTAIQTTIANGPALTVATSSASFDFNSIPGGATFECSLDGGAFASCPAHYVITGLGDGPHTLDVRARNTDNVDATPAVWAWVVDTTPPDTSIDSGPTGVVSGAVSIAFSSPEAGATFECSLDAAAFAACTSPQQLTPTLGNHTFQVRAKDALGNADASPAQRSWGTFAETAITSTPLNPVASATATFQFSASDISASFECSMDGTPFGACVSGAQYTSLGDGAHTFRVRTTGGGVVDPTPASYTWTVDTTGPVVNLTSMPAAIQSQNPTFVFSSPEGTATFECHLDGGAWGPCTSPVSYTVPASITAGGHTFYVRGVDTLSNRTNPVVSYSWSQAPETTITWAPLAWTNRTTEKVAFSSTMPGATFECQLDGAAYFACVSPRAFSVANGAHTVNVRAVYTSGSTFTDPTPATTTFSVSTSSPLLSYNFNQSVMNDHGQLSGYTGTLGGAAGYSNGSTDWFFVSSGLYSAAFAAQDANAAATRGWITLTGVRPVLAHDVDPTDGKYTIAFYYWEHSPANLMTANLSPTLFDNRNPVGAGGGLNVYHGSYNASWIMCWTSTPANGACTTTAVPPQTWLNAATQHRMVIEYAYNGTTTGFDLKLYIDGTLVASVSTPAGQAIFNMSTYDPVIGKDWWGFIDNFQIWNTTFAGSPP